MRPAITGDAKALAMRKVLVELRDFAMRHGHIALEESAADAAAAIDLPEPEPTAKAEEEPDYTCQKCGVEDGCIHLTSERLSIANRRIAQLTRERDHFREVADLSKAAREVARSRAIQDTKDAAPPGACRQAEGDAGMREEALCVRQIVKKYLRDNGYDGLWCDECACVTDDIAPCGHIGEDCEAGYKRLVPPDESCGCCGQGCEHWHIEPKETQEETP